MMTSYPHLDKFDGKTMVLVLVLIAIFAIWLAIRAMKGGKRDG